MLWPAWLAVRHARLGASACEGLHDRTGNRRAPLSRRENLGPTSSLSMSPHLLVLAAPVVLDSSASAEALGIVCEHFVARADRDIGRLAVVPLS
jgi:hypothetical protein